MPTKRKSATAARKPGRTKLKPIRVKVILHEAEEGGYWAEVPVLPGCVTEGETRSELLANLREAIGCYLEEPVSAELPDGATVEEIAL